MKTPMSLGLVVWSLSILSTTASGASDESYSSVRDSAGKAVRNSNGDCVRALSAKQNIAAECEPAKAAALAPPTPAKAPEPAAATPEAAPVAAVTPTPVPVTTPAPPEQTAAAAPEPRITETPAAPIAVVPAPVAAATAPAAAPEVITIKGDALFGFNRTDIKPEARKQLSEITGKLKGQQDIEEIIISGHTDSAGPEAYNQELSKKRAESVKQFLIEEGIVSKRIVVQALGEEKPIASNDTEAGRAQNRRVEISVQTVTTAK